MSPQVAAWRSTDHPATSTTARVSLPPQRDEEVPLAATTMVSPLCLLAGATQEGMGGGKGVVASEHILNLTPILGMSDFRTMHGIVILLFVPSSWAICSSRLDAGAKLKVQIPR